jgi:hypothetical protein
VLAREWFAKFEPNWVASHSDKIMSRLERDMFPWIGGRPIAELKAPELLTCLRRIEHRGASNTAARLIQRIGHYRTAGRSSGTPSASPRGTRSEWTCLQPYGSLGRTAQDDAAVADYLDKLKAGDNVVPIRGRAT